MNELIEDFKKYEIRKAKYITFSLDCDIRSKKTCKQAERTRIQLEIIKKMKIFLLLQIILINRLKKVLIWIIFLIFFLKRTKTLILMLM